MKYSLHNLPRNLLYLLEKYILRTYRFIKIVQCRKKVHTSVEGDVELKLGLGVTVLDICSINYERQNLYLVLKTKHNRYSVVLIKVIQFCGIVTRATIFVIFVRKNASPTAMRVFYCTIWRGGFSPSRVLVMHQFRIFGELTLSMLICYTNVKIKF